MASLLSLDRDRKDAKDAKTSVLGGIGGSSSKPTYLPDFAKCVKMSDKVSFYDWISATIDDCNDRIYGYKNIQDDLDKAIALKDELTRWLCHKYIDHSETFTGTQTERLAISLSGLVGQCRLYLLARILYAKHDKDWMDVSVLSLSSQSPSSPGLGLGLGSEGGGSGSGTTPENLGIVPGLSDANPYVAIFESMAAACYSKSIYTFDPKTHRPIVTPLKVWQELSDKLDLVSAALTIVSSESGIGTEYDSDEEVDPTILPFENLSISSTTTSTATEVAAGEVDDEDGGHSSGAPEGYLPMFESKETTRPIVVGVAQDEKKSDKDEKNEQKQKQQDVSINTGQSDPKTHLLAQRNRDVRNETSETASRLHYWIQMQLLHIKERKMHKLSFKPEAYQRMRAKFNDYMFYEPDNSLLVAFNQWIYAHNMPCGLHTRYHQMYPPHSFDTEIVTVMNEMLTRDQIKAIQKLMNAVELQTLYKNKSHPYMPLFELFLFGSLLAQKYRLRGFLVKDSIGK